MTYFDLINAYLFNYTSSLYRKNPKEQGCTMVEEMNEIRKMYQDNTPIKDVLRECVCQRHGHQYCISQIAVNDATDALLKSEFNDTIGLIYNREKRFLCVFSANLFRDKTAMR